MKSQPDSDIAQTLGIEHSSKHIRRLRRLLVPIVSAVTVALAAVVWWKSTANANAPKYETQEARRGGLSVSVSATGTLEPVNQVAVGSELSGIIETVEADYNQSVKVGQVLARLDTEKLEAQVVKSQAALESAQAKVLEARANVLETRSELERLKQVWEKTNKKAPSQQDMDAAAAASDRAQAAEASANAQVSEAQATLDANKTDLAKAVIRSPINGIVLTREVEPGQTVAASLQAPTLFTLAEDLTQMELHVDVDEADVGQVKERQDATFTVDAYPDMIFRATVGQVRYGSQTVNGVVTYETVLNVNNSDLLLRPGMTATADITVKKVEDAVLVPNAALRFSLPVQESQPSSQGGSITSKLLPRPPRRASKQEEKDSTDA
ncbi:MAG: efflux RND transporter periplasmic adaptor subunit, partial [Candidatus Lindowbacteria bacterium]|nr:efflux RND transporter periplasmic adaptor subunit [Candidatus Lindowbacteria bacterium]